MVKNLPAMWETWVPSLGWENPLEEEMTTVCDRQVVPTEGGLRGFLLHAVPVP